MGASSEFDPFEQYRGKAPASRRRFVKWFHDNRLLDFANWIEPGETLLSVGSGNAELESTVLADRFDAIYALDVNGNRARTAHEKDLVGVQASAPPLPFDADVFDAIVAAGTMEHLPDERGFVEDARRCLRPNGSLYLTLPIEVGMGGLLRYLGRNLVYPDRGETTDGVRRFFDYSAEELFKTTPRNKHGMAHRYYNYVYAINDLKELFPDVTVRGWPVEALGPLNLIYYVKATNGPRDPG